MQTYWKHGVQYAINHITGEHTVIYDSVQRGNMDRAICDCIHLRRAYSLFTANCNATYNF